MKIPLNYIFRNLWTRKLTTLLTASGMGPLGLALRPQVKIVAGRTFRPGSSEILVGSNIASEFDGTGIGERLRFAGREWTIVGTFDGGKSGFDSEVWGDVEQMMQAFRRVSYSVVIARLQRAEDFERFKEGLAGEQRLTLDVKQEPLFYEEQSRQLSQFISILGVT